eukprot:525171_1
MATNTWNKIKKKFKWKKGSSRSRKSNRYNSPNIISFRKRQKKKVSKSNIFGCLTTVPTEYKQYNVEQHANNDKQNNNNNNTNNNNTDINNNINKSITKTE